MNYCRFEVSSTTYLNHGSEGFFGVFQLGLATNTDNTRIVRATGNHSIKSFRSDGLGSRAESQRYSAGTRALVPTVSASTWKIYS